MNRHSYSLLTAAALIALLLVAGTAVADEPEFEGASSSNTEQADCPTAAKNFDPFDMAWLVDGLDVADGERGIRCVTEVRNGGKGRKGVKVTLEGEIVDVNGNTIQDLGTKSGRTNKPPGYKVIDFPVGLSIPDDYGVVMNGRTTSNKKITNRNTTCTAYDRKPCAAGEETLCLLDDNRFKVEVDFSSSSGSGKGQVLSSGFDTGTFYFFNPDRDDLLVQLINACKSNDHFWVFYQASTSVDFDMTVTDTETGTIKTYGNPLGQAFQAVTDTSAFATCP